MTHLSMEQLIALRDDDRSEPGMALARDHFHGCAHCQHELERLHQRTARLRALPTLVPGVNEFPVVRERIVVDRRQRRWRSSVVATTALAASMLVLFAARDMARPERASAQQQLADAMARSQQLEAELRAWNPDARVMSGSTAIAVIDLERRIADLDAQLEQAPRLDAHVRTARELELWRQRVGLMDALVNVQVSNATNVGL